MASDINRVILIGRLTRDSELKSTNSGGKFCRFSLASNRSIYNKQTGESRDEAGFFDCVLWAPSTRGNGESAEEIRSWIFHVRQYKKLATPSRAFSKVYRANDSRHPGRLPLTGIESRALTSRLLERVIKNRGE